jgi:hypothetical protein
LVGILDASNKNKSNKSNKTEVAVSGTRCVAYPVAQRLFSERCSDQICCLHVCMHSAQACCCGKPQRRKYLEDLLQIFCQASIIGRDEGCRCAVVACTACTPDAVHVILDLP